MAITKPSASSASSNPTKPASGARKAGPVPYGPDYVSAETLAHRLDCSKTTVHGYVRRGILPKPIRIGDLVRWRWVDVEKCIEFLETGEDCRANADDAYLTGIEHGSPQEASN